MGMYTIKMPDIGEGIAEVELVAWRVQAGDEVKEDQILADVMTDKATVEIPSPVAGRVAVLGGEPGQVMAVGSELIRLEVAGEGNVKGEAAAPPARAVAALGAGLDYRLRGNDEVRGNGEVRGNDDSAVVPAKSLPPAKAGAGTQVPVVPAKAGTQERGAAPPSPPGARDAAPSARDDAPAPQPPTRPPGERPIASPAVRRRAWDLGIELQFVNGSGPAGRITHEDLDVYLAARGRRTAPTAARGPRQRHGEEAVPVIGLRRRIAQKMQEAKRRIPHFSYVEEIDVTALEALRVQLNERFGARRGKLTLLPFIARAVVIAVEDFPQINARYDDEANIVTRHAPVHLGIAAQTDGGLMVPVIRHAEAQDLWALAAEIARLAEAARSGKATREELAGSTLTITSLGPLGGIVTTPVINHPEVGIVGVNRVIERPVFHDGVVVARKLMNLSSSFDHRVVDGMDAARFIQAVRALLECPALLLVEGDA
ncbi:MAG: dihydrolipoamide acetyltransferase family protein [Pseudomonadota bacterium]